MAEIILRPVALTNRELVFDDADIVSMESPRDLIEVPCDQAGCDGCNGVHRRLGDAHLHLHFAPGKQAAWREVT